MKRRDLIRSCVALGAATTLAPNPLARAASHLPAAATPDRDYWLSMLERVALPVLTALSQRKLVATMPVEAAPGHEPDRRRVTHLEACARTLAGIAPWLEHGPGSGPEGALRERFCQMAREAIAAGVDRNSPDYLRFGEQSQTIVDAGFLALAMARAPHELCTKLPASVKTQLADALRSTRVLLAPYNNWLLFVAMVEAALHQLGEPWDRARVDYALRQHQHWFLGDGVYGDGPHLHVDYYDSYVIYPFLLAVTDALADQEPAWKSMVPAIHDRAARYAVIQERMIAPDGSFPVVGRSICYRCGAFQLLADIAARNALPAQLAPEQVRGALTAVMRRTLDPRGTFDPNGWLRIGLVGSQPSLGETYISTGSLYLCTAAFLPLGLPAEDRFWTGPATPSASQRVWRGDDLPADHADDE